MGMNSKCKIVAVLIGIAALLLFTGIAISVSLKQDKYLQVSFDTAGGGYLEAMKVKKGQKLGTLEKPSRTGYRFSSWMVDGEQVDDDYVINGNIKLVAVWEEITDDTVIEYTVTFDTDGGNTIHSQTVKEGEKAVKPSTNPTKAGYVFKEWTLNGTAYDFSTVLTGNITLKATWEEEKKEENPSTGSTTPDTQSQTQEKKYKVTFDSSGGSNVAVQTVKEGAKATKPTDPTRSGYRFDGWFLNGKAYNFSSAVTGNITLIAHWTKISTASYTVTFDSNGGSAVSSQTVTEGNRATQPSSPTKNGYHFGGWFLNGISYNFNSAVTGNITLVAKWNQKSYTISVTKVDPYSPDSTLSVFEEGRSISVQAIKYRDGTYLCSGTNTTVNTGDISGVTSFIVVLSDGTQVIATVG